jgi:alkylation response protein AidB-like acyl-CoA dehydrogenase
MTSTAESLLSDIQRIAPDIAARATEIETGRDIPTDLVETLRSVGVFRLLVPRSHGGLELELPVAAEVIAALAKIEGSVGWIAMIAGVTQLLAALLPRETYDQIYRNGPDVIFAGSNQPAGTAEATSGGWRVSCRWPFASGSQHADWIAGYCVMMQDGAALPGPVAGAPLMRGFFLPAHHWQIEDTWYSAGLKGTGSHHVVLKDTVVPDANFFDLMGGLPCLPGPLYQAPLQTFPLLHGPFGVGVADGALDELVAHARTGRQHFRAAASMRDTEAFQYELGRTESELRAARAFLEVQVASPWPRALTGTHHPARLGAVGRAALLRLENAPLGFLHTLCLHHRKGFIRHADGGGDVLVGVRRRQKPIVMRVQVGAAQCDFRAEALLAAQARVIGKAEVRDRGRPGRRHGIAVPLAGRD